MAARYGAVTVNPVRDVDRITARPRREPSALTSEEWVAVAESAASRRQGCEARPFGPLPVPVGHVRLLAWLTSHSFRKAVATTLDHRGHRGCQVADQLGHSRPSMTQDVYLSRKAANPAAAEALEQFRLSSNRPVSQVDRSSSPSWAGGPVKDRSRGLERRFERGLQPGGHPLAAAARRADQRVVRVRSRPGSKGAAVVVQAAAGMAALPAAMAGFQTTPWVTST